VILLQIYLLIDDVGASSLLKSSEYHLGYLLGLVREEPEVIARGFVTGISTVIPKDLLPMGVWSDCTQEPLLHGLCGFSESELDGYLSSLQDSHAAAIRKCLENQGGYLFAPPPDDEEDDEDEEEEEGEEGEEAQKGPKLEPLYNPSAVLKTIASFANQAGNRISSSTSHHLLCKLDRTISSPQGQHGSDVEGPVRHRE